MDGDGDIDVLAPSHGDDKIAWYENDGLSPPTFTERVITEDPDGTGPLQGFADGASSAFAIDLDGDGDIDVLSASWDDDKIAWYENTTCGDGLIEGAEECDDGNTVDGDGCSATCTVEPGSKCTGEPSVCITNIPAVSQWGLAVMGLLVLVAGTIVVMRGRRVCV